jgi:integrase
MSGSFTPVEGHPGFVQRRGLIYFRFRDHRGRRRWGPGSETIEEAIARREEAKVDVRRGDYRQHSQESFTSYARSWLDTYEGRTSRGITETTRDDYRRRIEQEAIPYFGKMRLSEIAPQDVKGYARKLERRGLAPNTVRLAVAPVRALFATAVEEGLIPSNPAAGLRLAQRRDPDHEERVKAMSEEQLRALLAAIPEAEALFFRVLAWSGLRIGEMVELRWSDVDLGERIVHVRRRFHDGRIGPPKSRFGKRRLRLTPDLARALWRLRAETRAGDSDLVFTAHKGGRIHPSNLMRRVLKPAAAEAGLGEWVREGRKLRAESWVGFHTFRHTCATIIFRRGWNAVQVQRWLGHHKPSFTLDTYVHLLDEDVPEPTFFDHMVASGDPLVTRDAPKEAETPMAADGANQLFSS